MVLVICYAIVLRRHIALRRAHASRLGAASSEQFTRYYGQSEINAGLRAGAAPYTCNIVSTGGSPLNIRDPLFQIFSLECHTQVARVLIICSNVPLLGSYSFSSGRIALLNEWYKALVLFFLSNEIILAILVLEFVIYRICIPVLKVCKFIGSKVSNWNLIKIHMNIQAAFEYATCRELILIMLLSTLWR